MSFEEGIKQITAEELLDIFKNKPKNVEIIDVREPFEYEEAHIPGVKLIPMGSIPEAVKEFDKNKEYIFICRSGNRSQKVCSYLKGNGLEKVINFSGGMLDWTGPTE